MKKKIKAAIVGYGHIAKNFHVPAIIRSKKFEISAVCEINKKSNRLIKKKFKLEKVYHSFKDMIQRELFDTIFIFAPPFLHKKILEYSLKFKKNIFIEKPLVINSNELKGIKKLLNNSDSKLQCALHQRFRPISVQVKNLINQKRIGKIYFVNIVHRKFRAIPKQSYVFSKNSLSGGGPLIDLGSHYFDLVAWILNYPKILSSYCRFFNEIFKQKKQKKYLPFKSYNNEEAAIGSINFNNNILLNFELCYVSNTKDEQIKIEFFGTKGSVNWPENKYHIVKNNKITKKSFRIQNKLASNLQIYDFYKNLIKKTGNNKYFKEYEYIVNLIDLLYKKSKVNL
jgi:predicted dehydrogenase